MSGVRLPSLRRFVAPAMTCVLALLGLCGVEAASARADAVPTATEAVAVRGEPLVVEVRVTGDGAVGAVALAAGTDGRRVALRHRLVWPYLPLPSGDSLLRWAAASSPLRFAEARPVGATLASLVVELPAAVPDDATLEVGASRLRLSVFDAGPPDLFDRLARRASMLVPPGAPDPLLTLPDPDAPLERFRYAIGVPMRGWPAPRAFPPDGADAAVERAHTALWRAAIARAMAAAPGPATELAELLVASCADATAPAPIAAWIASPDELRAVLRLAFSRDFSGERLAASVNEFLRVRGGLFWWIDGSDAGSVTLALANPTTREQVVKVQWLAGSEEDMLPLALAVPAVTSRRERIERPTIARNPLAPDQPIALEQLRVSCGSAVETVVAPRARLSIDAGGLDLADTFAPLHLVSVSPGRRGAVASGSSRVSVRERLSGWEVFVEARSPATAGGSPGAIAVAGPAGGLVRIDASAATTAESTSLSPDAVEFAAFRDRFRASFALPPEWVRRESGETVVELGFRREIEGGFADAPFPCTPWTPRPRTILLDLAPRQ